MLIIKTTTQFEDMVLLDLFSGIGGFHEGLSQAGFKFKKVMFSEIDKYAISVYQNHFKDAEYVGSVTDVQGTRGQADIITFGSPCQDFSIAGKRSGMGGERSSLITHAIRLITEIQPKFFIWENVKGTFSSNDGEDFWAIIKAFADIGGYRLEWQLLNTSWFLPQNRERVYLVGTLGGGSGREIFPVRQDDEQYNEMERGQSQVAGTINSCMAKGGNKQDANSNVLIKVAQSALINNRGILENRDIASRLDANLYKGMDNHGQRTMIKVGTLRTHKDGEGFREVNSNLCPTIPARAREDGSGQPVIKQLGRGFNEGGDHKIAPPLTSCAYEQNNHLSNNGRIRRLTPIECERLQGFEDNWTKFGIAPSGLQEVEISDTQRYKMCGNAVSVPVVRAVGDAIMRANS